MFALQQVRFHIMGAQFGFLQFVDTRYQVNVNLQMFPYQQTLGKDLRPLLPCRKCGAWALYELSNGFI